SRRWSVGGRELVGWATTPCSSTASFSTPNISFSEPSSVENTPVANNSFLSTNTDELIAGLPDTPTAIVLGGDGLSTPLPMNNSGMRDYTLSVVADCSASVLSASA